MRKKHDEVADFRREKRFRRDKHEKTIDEKLNEIIKRLDDLEKRVSNLERKSK